MRKELNVKEIGTRVYERRKELNLTQDQLAYMLNTQSQWVSNLERGIKCPRIENVIRLSEVLNVSTDFLLLGKRNDSENAELANKISQLSEDEFKAISTLLKSLAK